MTLEAGVPPSEVPRCIVVLSASAGLVPIQATRPEEAHEEDVRNFIDSLRQPAHLLDRARS